MTAGVSVRASVQPMRAPRERPCIMKHCKAHIAKYALPSEIEFRASLPTTLVGKVAYIQLEKEEASRQA